jgi:broad-specificity NMP kinase
MQSQRIYITGFMGSGKSTIGPILANTLGWDFYDLDDEIEKLLKKSIVDLKKMVKSSSVKLKSRFYMSCPNGIILLLLSAAERLQMKITLNI